MAFLLKCENAGYPWWIADWEGDPGRTVIMENARIFPTQEQAQKFREKVDKRYPWRNLGERLEVHEFIG